jgi:ABC-type sugar transport system ATPase subunit
VNVHAGFMRTTPAELAHGVELREISKSFAAVEALAGVSLTAGPGELLALTGPSGAGKTTMCRIIAGLETPDQGSCRIAGKNVAAVPAASRRVAYMFESYALYPHMTVRENVMSPLLAPNGRSGDAGGIDVLLDFLEIRHLAERLPAELSGGQKQRVALARTLVQKPAVTLLDEPISHLDAKLRHKLRNEIRRLVTSRPSPTLWCTPDAMEALAVGDRIAVIEAGRIEQIGTPEEVWRRPATVRVARLVGDPPMNLLPGRVALCGSADVHFVCGDLRVPLSAGLATAARLLGHDSSAVLGIRPNLVAVVPAGTPGAISVELYSHEPFGKYAIVTARMVSARTGDVLVKSKTGAMTGGRPPARIGAAAGLLLPSSGFVLFEAASGKAVASDSFAADDPAARVVSQLPES